MFHKHGHLWLFRVAVSLLLASTAFSQLQIRVSPTQTVWLAALLGSQWRPGFRIIGAVAGRQHLYLVLSSSDAGEPDSLLVAVSETGSVEGIKGLSGGLAPWLGVDGSGNVVVIHAEDSHTAWTVKYSPDLATVVQAKTILPDKGPGAQFGAAYRSRGLGPRSTSVSVPDHPIAKVSPTIPGRNGPYVAAVLEDGRRARIDLTKAEILLSNPTSGHSNTLSIDRGVLGNYGTHKDSAPPNIFYPDLYSPVISPRGGFWALVAGRRLESGVVAVRVDLVTATVDSAVQFDLPHLDQLKNSDNPIGYFVPAFFAICDNYAVLIDPGVALLCMR